MDKELAGQTCVHIHLLATDFSTSITVERVRFANESELMFMCPWTINCQIRLHQSSVTFFVKKEVTYTTIKIIRPRRDTCFTNYAYLCTVIGMYWTILFKDMFRMKSGAEVFHRGLFVTFSKPQSLHL